MVKVYKDFKEFKHPKERLVFKVEPGHREQQVVQAVKASLVLKVVQAVKASLVLKVVQAAKVVLADKA